MSGIERERKTEISNLVFGVSGFLEKRCAPDTVLEQNFSVFVPYHELVIKDVVSHPCITLPLV